MKLDKAVLIGAFFGLVLTGVFFHDFITKIDKPVRDHDDMLASYFILGTLDERLVHLDFAHFYDNRMFYPLKNTATYGNSLLAEAVMGVPFYVLSGSAIVTMHSVLILNLFLTFLATYLFVFYLTKNWQAGVISGMIFAFNPFVMSHFPQQIELTVLFWIPLIFLCAEKLLKKIEWKWQVVLCALLVMQSISSFYYAFYVALFLPIYFCLRLLQEKKSWKYLIDFRIALTIIVAGLASVFLLWPYLQTAKETGLARPLEIVDFFSARLPDFLFAPAKNVLYGGLIGSSFAQIRNAWSNIHYTEHSLFAGVVAYAFLAVGVYLLFRKSFVGEERKNILIWLIVLALAFVLSFGPYFNFGQIHFPSPYVLFYNFLPFVNMLRASSRVMVMGFLALAVISGFVWNHFSGRSSKFKWLFWLVVLLLVFEYRTVFDAPVVVSSDNQAFYSWLDRQTGIKAIVELPIANDFNEDAPFFRAPQKDNQYLLYALNHDKYLVNGFDAFVPPDVTRLGSELTIGFPSQTEVAKLSRMGVDLAVVHQEEFSSPALGRALLARLRASGLRELFTTSSVSAFEIPH